MKYFENMKDEIKNDFEFIDESIITQSHCIVNPIKEKHNNCVIIGIHIRRGDVTINEKSTEMFLYNALNEYQDIKNKVFFVFSGGNHNNDNSNDLEWCKNMIESNFNGIFYFSENFHVLLDFCIMINCCEHLILTSTSTLGWWAAYLNKNENKRIACQKKENLCDYWPENYITL